MKTTSDIEKEYLVSRQTLMSWMKNNIIATPQKNWRGWYCWDETAEKELRKFLLKKAEEKNILVKKKELPKLYIHNRRYLGSKRKLIDFIIETISPYDNQIRSVADIFGGTGVVADAFRKKGKKIIINDILQSNYVAYQTWFGNEKVDKDKIKYYINKLNSLEGTSNYVSENFGNAYFSMENAMKIGAIREEIEKINDINKREKSFLLTSLIYATDKVANTVGHYDAYRKKMDSHDSLVLKIPAFNNNENNEIYCNDANRLVKEISADLTYIDTPYNSRQYGDAYHLLENIVEWKKPELMGVAKKMIDRRKIKSLYSTNKAPQAFEDLIKNINSKYILVSYNNMAKKGDGRSNAKISNEEIIEILSKKGNLKIYETSFSPFTTGKSKIDDHKELLYLCEVKYEFE
ncbi:DNA adenine methylase [Enterococcus faecium]